MNIETLKSARDNLVYILEAITEARSKDLKSGFGIDREDMTFIEEAVGAIKELTEIIEKSEVESNESDSLKIKEV